MEAKLAQMPGFILLQNSIYSKEIVFSSACRIIMIIIIIIYLTLECFKLQKQPLHIFFHLNFQIICELVCY